MSLPFVSATGTLVADVEIKFATSGKAIAKLRIACNERKRGDDGEWYDSATSFLSLTLFGAAAEDAAELRKGQRIVVTGRLAQRVWEQDGVKRSDYELKVDSLGAVPRAANRQSAGSNWAPETPEEIPF